MPAALQPAGLYRISEDAMTKGELQAILFIAVSLLVGAVVLLAKRYDSSLLPDLAPNAERPSAVLDPSARSPAERGDAATSPETPSREQSNPSAVTSIVESGRPDTGAPIKATSPKTISSVDDGLVRVNTATASELQRLPGIGPTLAERIIAFRRRSGAFASIEQMLEVKGIGPAKLERLRPHVVLP